MKKIEYIALNSSGEKINGLFDGSKEEFLIHIKHKKLTILEFKEIKKRLNTKPFNQKDFIALVEELYYLSKSGMPIDMAIRLLLKSTTKVQTIEILKAILMNLKAGKQFSIALKESLEAQNFTIDRLSIGFISIAEEVGDLSSGLLQLFEYLSFQKKIKGDIKQALSYPIFLLIMSFVVSLIIFFVVIPKFSTIFSPEEFEKLPTLSKTVLSMGRYVDAHAIEVLSVLGLIGVGATLFLKLYNINWTNLFYRVPKLSVMIVDLQLSIIYGALGTMIKGGFEIDKALRELSKISMLDELKNLIHNALGEIKRGNKLSDVFESSSLIPSSDIALLYVGESSASLDLIFASLSKRHADTFSEHVKRFLSILEPLVIVGLGIFIAVIVVSIMMAVMSMSDIAG